MTGWLQRSGERLLAWAGRIGDAEGDDSDTQLRKRLAVLLFAGTLPFTVAWSVIYWAAGAPLAAAIPGFYSLVTPLNTALFAATRNLGVYRFTQLLMIMLLPFLLMLALGGYAPGEGRLGEALRA